MSASTNLYVTTLMGYRRHLEDIGSPDHIKRAAAERQAINTIIQVRTLMICSAVLIQCGTTLCLIDELD